MREDNELLLLEGLPPKQDKRVVFMIGRLNPPHLGHYKIINKMKEYIRKNPKLNLEAKPIVVIIAGDKSSKDKSKNPLSVEERISFMKSSGKANGVEFLTAKNAFVALGVIRDNGYEPIVIGAGSDRAGHYKKLLDKGFKDENGKDIMHYIIPDLDRLDTAVTSKKTEKQIALDNAIETLSTEDLGDEEISASLARHAVKLGYLEEFTKIVGLEAKPKLAKLMFDKIEKSITEKGS